MDFAKKSGVLRFSLHPQFPLLVAHWHSHVGGSSAIAWEFCPSIGGGSGASSNSGVLSEWCELLSASTSGGGGGRTEDDAATHVVGLSWVRDTLICYRSTGSRSLFTLGISSNSSSTSSAGTLTAPSLCSKFTLSFEQYWNYQDVPSRLVSITVNPEPSSGEAEFVLHHTSLQTGASDKLDDLLVWKSYQGKQLVPWTVVANQGQTVLCVKLRDRTKPQWSLRTTQHAAGNADDHAFSYVVLEIKEKAGGSGSTRLRGDLDEGDSVGSNFRVSCGSQLEALDLCFADSRSDDAKHVYPWVLVVLASTGKSLCVQVKCSQLETSRIVLQRDVLRVFSSPIPLSLQSPYSSAVGSRLLYVTLDNADSRPVLELSEDDLSVPRVSSSNSWKASAADEAILNVQWNTVSVSELSAANNAEVLIAVMTMRRAVVLTRSFVPVRAYDLTRELLSPQSLLWVAQSLLFVTKDHQLRYLTPLQPDTKCSRLVCSLNEEDRSTVQHVELLSVCGDRLAYSVTDTRTLETRVFLRPLSLCEPLAAGFVTPNAKLKAILERDVLVFAMTGGSESPSPLSDHLLRVLHDDFGWENTTLRLLDALVASGGSNSGSSAAAMGGGSLSSAYSRAAHLSIPQLAAIYLDAHKWRAFLKVFLASDPGLEEYAFADEDSSAASSAKLPSRTGPIAQRFRALGHILGAVGQSELALKCFDLAGDDLAIVEMARRTSVSSTSLLIASLQRDWTKLNPPLASLVSAEKAAGSTDALAQLDSVVWRRHDLFSLLCCESLLQNERRSRLLASVKPFDKSTVQVSSKREASREEAVASCPRAVVLPWKRLVPEDTQDWIGASTTPHFSSDEPKNPNYGFAPSTTGALASGGSAASLGVGLDLGGTVGGDIGASAAASGTGATASAKIAIGPFVDDEDAVVAYWRFEEGATLSPELPSDGSLVESLDTSKRENNLQLLGFGAATSLVSSSAPVDKGEDGRVQEEFALRFPSTESCASDALERAYGAKCIVRSGSTLDIGFVFDDDPYRRKLTFEAWLRNFVLAQKLKEQQEHESDDYETSALLLADAGTRPIVVRQSSSSGIAWWSFALVDGYLVLEFAGSTVTSDERVVNAATWHHAAFSIDVHSPKHAAIKLYLQGRCVGARDVAGVDSVNTKIYSSAVAAAAESSDPLSYLLLGSQLSDYEMTEVRVWAAARTQDQVGDMKENYLGIAEAKKRMKIAIHQRNCQCEKCHARRAKPAVTAKLGVPFLATPFPSTPLSSGSVRDRRRPTAK